MGYLVACIFYPLEDETLTGSQIDFVISEGMNLRGIELGLVKQKVQKT